MTTPNKILVPLGLVVVAGAASAMYALFTTEPVDITIHTVATPTSTTLTTTSGPQPQQSTSEWIGTYVREGSTDGASASIEISNERDTTFAYKLSSFNGSHIGEIASVATNTGNTAASLVPESECSVTFRKDANRLTIQTTDCSGFHGVRAGFDGVYVLGASVKRLTLRELGGDAPIFRSHAEADTFSRMIKPAYADSYINSFIDISVARDEDEFGARVYKGGVPGLYTVMEGIIIIAEESGAMWAAIIQDNVVIYTTNVPEYEQKLPKTIETWRGRFADKQIVYLSSY